jgi:hypothetical protein
MRTDGAAPGTRSAVEFRAGFALSFRDELAPVIELR